MNDYEKLVRRWKLARIAALLILIAVVFALSVYGGSR